MHPSAEALTLAVAVVVGRPLGTGPTDRGAAKLPLAEVVHDPSHGFDVCDVRGKRRF